MSVSAHRSALLVIDMQVGLFNGPERPMEGERILATINTLARNARKAGCPVILIRHTGPEGSPIAPGSPFWQLVPGLETDASVDIFIDKMRPSCFHGTGLAERLVEAGVDEVVICGMKTQYCVDSTCRQARDLGFRAVLVADAHTCMDTPALSARAIIEHHNQTLNGPFVNLLNASQTTF
ncbi:cysteine hydrolase family protein [Pseudomonas sp. Pseusp122]|uniref:cysteine hydrolase family protein n=1 Tax=unclassified Pseudomonas TaxID=196821 RepID=UPI0039A49897